MIVPGVNLLVQAYNSDAVADAVARQGMCQDQVIAVGAVF